MSWDPVELSVNIRSLLAFKLEHFSAGVAQPYSPNLVIQQDRFLLFSSYPGCEPCAPVFEQLRRLRLEMTIAGNYPFLIVNMPFGAQWHSNQEFLSYYASKNLSWPWVRHQDAAAVQAAIGIGGSSPDVRLYEAASRSQLIMRQGWSNINLDLLAILNPLIWGGKSKSGLLAMAV